MDKINILIVEDSHIIAVDLKNNLMSQGYTISAVVSTGEEAIKKAEENNTDLVLMDIVLDGKMDGIEAARVIRSRFDVPIIYLTAYDDKEKIDRAKLTEASGYITKPVKYGELHRAIEMAVYKGRMEKKLKEKGLLLQTILKSMDEGILVMDREYKIQMANQFLLELVKKEEDEIIGKRCDSLSYGVGKDSCPDCAARETFQTGKKASVYHTVTEADGSKAYLEITSFPIVDEDGNVARVIEKVVDISERKVAVEALKKSREQLQSIIDNTTSVIYIKDIEGKYLLINSQYEKLFHITKKEIIGKTDFDIFPGEMAEAFRENDLKAIKKLAPIEIEEIAPHDDGPHTYISIKFPLYDSQRIPYGVCGISTDITERKTLEEAHSYYSRKLVDMEEKGRKRIASELHDSFAQNMMVINNEIQKIFKNRPGKDDVDKSLKFISTIALQTSREINNIAYDLRPPQLDQLGLEKAIVELVQRISKSSGVSIKANINTATVNIPSKIEIHIYRIIQEGLNNIVKHSYASEGKVELKEVKKKLLIIITDDGKGIENDLKGKYKLLIKGFGLQSMEERAKMSNGTLEIDSRVGIGTKLIITIPLK